MYLTSVNAGSKNAVEKLIELAAISDLEGFKESADRNPSSVDGVGLWYGPTKHSNQMVQLQRTPLMVAATYGSIDVLKYVISLPRVDVNQSCGDDKSTALHCAASGGSTNAVESVQLLLDAGADLNMIDAHGRRPQDVVNVSPNLQEMKVTLQGMLSGEVQIQGEPSSSASTSTSRTTRLGSSAPARKEYPVHPNFPDIKNSVYTTDEFRMFSFKIQPCSRTYSHDWTECPFAHPGENARRRDPRKYHYSCLPCPDYRTGSCQRGDSCGFAHGVFESWLHPAQYRTQLCKDSTNCTRKVCFFAHSVAELRPLHIATSAVPMMSPVTYPPAISPSNDDILNMSCQLQLNVPTLHAPGSSSQLNRMHSSFGARHIPTTNGTGAQQQHSNCTKMFTYSARPMTLTPMGVDSSFYAEGMHPGYSGRALLSAGFLPSYNPTVSPFQRQQESLMSIFLPRNIDPSLLQDLGPPTSSIRSLPGLDPISPLNARIACRNQQQLRGRPSEPSEEYDELMQLASSELHGATTEPEL